MHLGPLDRTRADHVRDLARIYEAAFPATERLPLELLLAGTGGRRITVAAEDDGVVGFTSVLPHDAVGVVLLEYLATDAQRRSGGIGGRLLDHVVADAGPLDVLAEIEPPDSSPDATRRADFYRRHGFAPAPWQGDYGMPDPDGGLVPLELWHRDGHEPACAPTDLMRTVYLGTYGEWGHPHLARVLAGIR